MSNSSPPGSGSSGARRSSAPIRPRAGAPSGPARPPSLARFVLPSSLGVLFFLTPLPTGNGLNIGIGIVVDGVKALLGGALPWLVAATLCLSAVASAYGLVMRPRWRQRPSQLSRAFVAAPAGVLLRVAAATGACMVLFDTGPEWLASPDTGGTILRELMTVIFAVFLVASALMPFLTDFGLMEFVGTLARPVCRPVLTLPGRSAVDCAASWFGSSTVGVVITTKQFDAGYYTEREASVIALGFSVVSVAFAKVVADVAGVGHRFFFVYAALVVSGVAAAALLPRIPPLSRKRDRYSPAGPPPPEATPTGRDALSRAVELAVARAARAPSARALARSSAGTTLDIWFGLMPLVMVVGTSALAVAHHTPLFEWLSYPLIPFVELLRLPEAAAAAPALLVGFADQFLPVVLAQGIDSELTRFVVACASATQLVYMSEVGAFLLKSKLPLGVGDLLAVFLLRTLITVPICALIGHWVV